MTDAMRPLAVALLVLCACAKQPTPTKVGNDGDFCGMPADICEHRLVDEHGREIVPRECVEAGIDSGRE